MSYPNLQYLSNQTTTSKQNSNRTHNKLNTSDNIYNQYLLGELIYINKSSNDNEIYTNENKGKINDKYIKMYKEQVLSRECKIKITPVRNISSTYEICMINEDEGKDSDHFIKTFIKIGKNLNIKKIQNNREYYIEIKYNNNTYKFYPCLEGKININQIVDEFINNINTIKLLNNNILFNINSLWNLLSIQENINSSYFYSSIPYYSLLVSLPVKFSIKNNKTFLYAPSIINCYSSDENSGEEVMLNIVEILGTGNKIYVVVIEDENSNIILAKFPIINEVKIRIIAEEKYMNVRIDNLKVDNINNNYNNTDNERNKYKEYYISFNGIHISDILKLKSIITKCLAEIKYNMNYCDMDNELKINIQQVQNNMNMNDYLRIF